jgi:glycerone phosphate O-acyltransferase
VVSQYIQYHIKNFQAPIEFFLEGTRSRNGKSLPPKIGKYLLDAYGTGEQCIFLFFTEVKSVYLIKFSVSVFPGLLSMALEPYFRGDVPDIKICTVSITYERTLEEKLYAWEALGVPKPRESTSVG